MLVELYTPIFYSIKIKNAGSIPDTILNDSYFLGYMYGSSRVLSKLLDMSLTDANIVFYQFITDFFPDFKDRIVDIMNKNISDCGNTNPVFLEALKLACTEIQRGLKNKSDNGNLSLIKHIDDNYSQWL